MRVGWLITFGRVVGDGYITLFLKDPWLDGVPFLVKFSRLYELIENKLTTVTEMNILG
jgi:hypothetical protein